MSEEPKSFWAKLAAITAFLSALAAIGGLLYRCQESVPGPYPPPPTPSTAYYCCDLAGMRRCPLISPVAVGSACFCPYQGNGIACP